MNVEEYQTFTGDLFRRFPMIESWASRYDLDGVWYEPLEQVPIAHALAVLERWTFQGSPWGAEGASLWQEIPALVRNDWLDARGKLRRTEGNKKILATECIKQDTKFADTLRKIQAVSDPELQSRVIEKYMKSIPADDPYKQPRFDCKICLDQAVVVCYIRNPSDRRGYQTKAFACRCELGAVRKAQGLTEYDPSTHLMLRTGNLERDKDPWIYQSRTERFESVTGQKRFEEHEF